jgi:hypothetical protein
MGIFVCGMFPPSLSLTRLGKVAQGALEMLAIVFLGTLLVACLAALLLRRATRTVTVSSAFGEWPATTRLDALGSRSIMAQRWLCSICCDGSSGEAHASLDGLSDRPLTTPGTP